MAMHCTNELRHSFLLILHREYEKHSCQTLTNVDSIEVKRNSMPYSTEPMTNKSSILTVHLVRTHDGITVKVNGAGPCALQFESRVGV